ncbi:hypothetical protein Adt_16111 [Abeliophyllum distichum]|uniref:Myb/SANT-like domain-containing protein n=1 Tax=Abeliophyllum distichum TaxID=126358 RepID=A0ABD1TCR0_9LAMI
MRISSYPRKPYPYFPISQIEKNLVLFHPKGFSWDESRQMVTADNEVWDNYIKAHPNSRPYRVKTILYYHDLCEMYKNATFGCKNTIFRKNIDCNDGTSHSDTYSLSEGVKYPHPILDDEKPGCRLLECSPHLGNDIMESGCVSDVVAESLHDIMIDEDYGIHVTKEVVGNTQQLPSDIGSTIGARSRTYWQPPMDRYFINLMLDQVKKGNQVDGLFRKIAWTEMIALFNAKFGFDYEVDILKNRYKTLRRQCTVITNLLELDGFAWDDARQMVTADDRIWQDHIKAHTDARQYMTRPVPYYKHLRLIWKDLSSDIKDCMSGHNLEIQDEVPEIKFVQPFRVCQSPDVSGSDQFLEEEDRPSASWKILPSQGTSKKARSKAEGVVHALHEMAAAVSYLADKRKEDENLNSVPIENVIEAIQTLPDMDEDLVLDACDFLEDEKKAKTFLALDVKLRKKWLIRKLRPPQ